MNRRGFVAMLAGLPLALKATLKPSASTEPPMPAWRDDFMRDVFDYPQAGYIHAYVPGLSDKAREVPALKFVYPDGTPVPATEIRWTTS